MAAALPEKFPGERTVASMPGVRGEGEGRSPPTKTPGESIFLFEYENLPG